MSVEEKLSKSILYNLNVLKYIVKSNNQLDEVLTEGIFLKSNTQTFIQVTYYLFNIIDAKEFRKKFYWPIVDKKSENSYRTSSVEFINMQIDKHSLSQEKIKLVAVVHPSGKKFMSLMLDLILISIKELMRRKRFNSSKSMSIENAMEIAITINQVENDLMNSLQEEMRVIKGKTQAIQNILARIWQNDECEFEDMIKSWHSLNVTRMNTIKETQSSVRNVFRKAISLQDKAQKMLSDKNYTIMKPSDYELKKFNEFYHQKSNSNQGNKLSIMSLLDYLQSTLPIILNYVKNFSYEQAEVSDEEMRIVRQKLVELEKFDLVISRIMEKEDFVKNKIIKLRMEKGATKEEEFSFIMDDGTEDRVMKDSEEQEALRYLISPQYKFDISKNCTTSIPLKRNHLAFLDQEDGNIIDRSVLLNQSKFFIEPRLNRSRKEEMGPPIKTMQPLPSRRKRRDAMELLEQVTSKKCDLNSTSKYNGMNLRVHSTPFSSTLLSPDLIHHAANFNFSIISTISSATPASIKNGFENFRSTTKKSESPVPNVLDPSKEKSENIPWNNIQKMKEIQKSPVTKINLEDAFGDDMTTRLPNSLSKLPNIKLNDDEEDTLKNSPFAKDTDVTVYEKSYAFRKKSDEEDLFNISDSILVSE